MESLTLERFAYSPTETEGLVRLDAETTLYTLERPWRSGSPGGVPFESCVPDGPYELLRHTRPGGDEVLALWNPDLGVFYDEEEKGDQPGRYLILIHAGNYVRDVVGCIAPGRSRICHNGERMVTNSRSAMRLILDRNPERLHIRNATGTGENHHGHK